MTKQRKKTKREGARLLTGRLEDKWFAPYSAEQIENIAALGRVWSLNYRVDDIIRAARNYAYGKIRGELMHELMCVNARAWALSNAIYSLSPAARRRLERDLHPHGINLGALGALVVTLINNTAKSPGRGRRRLRERNIFLWNIGFAWQAMKKKDPAIRPGISKPSQMSAPRGGRRSGPFFRFLRACCEPFPELAELTDGALDKAFSSAYEALCDAYQK